MAEYHPLRVHCVRRSARPSSPLAIGRPAAIFVHTFAALALGACVGDVSSALVAQDLTGLPPDAFADAIVPTEGHAGWTGGTFAVSADGAATYRIPLWTPPGRAGIERPRARV
jgi:hypothetical protein